MTRKEAVLAAIEVLATDPQNEGICNVLSGLADDLPLVHWNKDIILDAFNQFISENNRFPSKDDIEGKNILPMRSTVERIFNMKFSEFHILYFSECPYTGGSRKYIKSEKYWLGIFKNEYIKMNYPTREEYKISRASGMPCAEQLVKLCGCRSWSELLNLCGFEQHYNPRNKKKHPILSIQVERPERISSKELKELNDEILRTIDKAVFSND